MANAGGIKSKSKIGHFFERLSHGALKGLKYGAGIGLGMGLLYAGLGVLAFGTPLGLAAAGLVGVALNTAVIGTALGAGVGAFKGVFTRPRPNLYGAHPGEDSPEAVSEAAAQQGVSQEYALAQQQAYQPQQFSAPQLAPSELQQLTERLNAARQIPADGWQARVQARADAPAQGRAQ